MGSEMCIRDRHTSDVNDLELTPDKENLISCSEDGYIMIWDVNEGKLLFKITLFGLIGGINNMTFNSNNGRMIAGSRDQILVFDLENLVLKNNSCFSQSKDDPNRIPAIKICFSDFSIKKLIC